MDVAESEMQRDGIKLLIDFYRTGDLKKWDEFNVHWARDTENATWIIINGFIETYSDPLGMKATWESIVEYTDLEATKRTRIITENAQWFEDNSPIDPKYRKEKVKGVAAKVINIAMLGGDCYPASPLGINLPNADWIRKEIGSKSVTLANIKEAYDITSLGNGFLEEFAADNDEIERIRKYRIHYPMPCIPIFMNVSDMQAENWQKVLIPMPLRIMLLLLKRPGQIFLPSIL